MGKKKELTIEDEIMLLKDFGILSSILTKLNDKIDKLREEFEDYDPNQDIDIKHAFDILTTDIDSVTNELETATSNISLLESKVEECENNDTRFEEELLRLEGEIEEVKPFVDAFNEM